MRQFAAVEDRERWRAIELAFDELAAADPAVRAAELTARFADQPELATRVAALLRAEQRAPPRFLVAAAPRETAPAPLPPGTMLGPWRLAAVLGQGGSGTVYLGSRPGDPRGELVAVKVLRREIGAAGLERLQRERQVLAHLDHKAIARLLDAGVSAEGHPYLVLEHIPGMPLDRFVAETRAPLELRVLLAIDLCAAVAALHRHLVLHLDLKPANVLVTARGEVKLVDFGVATLLGNAAGEEQRWLTPRYASPEQFLRGRAVSTASDVYSLGVVLYELFTGESPYQLPPEATTGEVRQVVTEVEPLRASERVRRVAVPDPVLARRLRGDLDAILARALRKEPAERYPSVEALGDDLARYLRHEAVRARRGNLLYHLGKGIRRHWLTAAALAALFVGLAGHSWSVERQRRVAEAERRRSESALDLTVQAMRSLGGSVAGGGSPGSLASAVDAVAALTAGRDPILEARVRGSLGRVQSSVGEAPQGKANLVAAWRLLRQHRGPRHLETLSALQDLAVWHLDVGEGAAGLRLLAFVHDGRREQLPAGDPEILMVQEILGRSLVGADLQRAAALLEDALAWRRGATPATPALQLAGSIDGVAWVAYAQRDLVRAAALADEALALRRRAGLAESLQQADTLALAGMLALERRDAPAALQSIREAYQLRARWLGDGHPRSLLLASATVTAALDAGEVAVALAVAERSHGFSDSLPADNPRRLVAVYDLATALAAVEDWPRVEALVAELAGHRLFGELALGRAHLEAKLAAARGDHAAAEPALRALRERLATAPDILRVRMLPAVEADLARLGERSASRAGGPGA